PAPSALYTLSLHDALPISCLECAHPELRPPAFLPRGVDQYPLTYGNFLAVASIAAPASSSTAVESHVPPTSWLRGPSGTVALMTDRKSTRLNSSHVSISYA